jgi:hypothetical protein
MHSAVAHCLAQRLGSILGMHVQYHDHPAKILSYEKEILGKRNQYLMENTLPISI